ncbi:MAG: bifunctional nicotinamidase/pyrazinamidase [Sandaracinaceae bacterium]|nr:bifunctional nicotinamidase/pyrazinamidase [Sandaracinaceae bacterium]
MHADDHALVLVDLQPDFLPGGALAVAEGDLVVPYAVARMQEFGCIVATQDWHPPDHGSFASQHPGKEPGELIELHGLTQVLWPDHCVQGTAGAELCAELDRERITAVFRKGSDPTVDSYSGFFDNGRRHATGLGDWLRERGVRALSVLGLATDYCVKFTALDARELGFEVTLLSAGCRGVELKPGDVARALDELRAAGVQIAE